MPTNIDFPEAFEFLFEPARYKGAYGGRGSAKSHSFAGALVLEAAQKPLRILCGREIQKSLRDSAYRLIRDKIADYNLNHLFTAVESEIRGPDGSLFVFAGLRSNPDTVKSMEGLDRAWLEEANRCSQRSLEILTPTLRKPGSEIWASWNPEYAKDPIDAFLRGEKPPDSIVREVSYRDNPWFPDVLRREMEWVRSTDIDKYDHIWEGGYRNLSESRVFRNWTIEEVPEPPNGTRFYFGADWGFSIDPTVLIRAWRCPVNPRRLYVDREVWQVGCEIDRTPALFDQMEKGQARKWPIYADSARPETISYMRRHGYPSIRSAKKGPGSVEDGIEFLKSFEIIVDPSCKHVIDELRFYSYKKDRQTDEVLPILEDKKNHTIDALRYAVESTRRAIKVPAPSSLRRTSPNRL